MNVKMLLNVRSASASSPTSARSNAEFISTLFDTQRLQPLWAHRIAPPSANKPRRPIGKRRIGLILVAALSFLLQLAAQAGQNVTIAWNPSPSGVAGYKLHYGDTSGNYTSHVDVGTNTSFNVVGLKEGQTNYFTVTAYNSIGQESAPSNELTYYVPGTLRMLGKVSTTSRARLQFAVKPSQWYEIQASTNLVNWTTIYQTSQSSSNGFVAWSDPQSTTLKQRFYRLVLH